MTFQERSSRDLHGPLLLMLWLKANNGKDFVEAAKQAGYKVAKWPYRHPFRIITPEGENLDLVRALNPQHKHEQGMSDTANKRLPITAAVVKTRLRSVWQDLPTIGKE